MDGVGQWLGIIGGFVGLVVFLGATVVYLRGSRDKGTITTLENSNRALSERVALLEAAEGRLASRVAVLEAENLALLAQRPSAEQIAVILTRIEALDAENRRTWTTHDSDMKALHADIKTILAAAAAESSRVARNLDEKDNP